MTSCSHSSRENDAESSEATEEKYIIQNDSEINMGSYESMYQDLVEKIEVLTCSSDSIRAELDSQTKQVAHSKMLIKRWRIFVIIASVLAAFALIFACCIKKRCLYKDQFRTYFNKCFNKLQEKQQQNTAQVQDPPLAGYSKDLVELGNRVLALENAIKKCYSFHEYNPERPRPLTQKVGYAKTNYNMMFTEVLSSNREGCVYKIDFINDYEGTFDLIELPVAQQTPGYKDVIEIIGGCPFAEAKRYEVISRGKCAKKESGKNIVWVVTEKLKIKTLR